GWVWWGWAPVAPRANGGRGMVAPIATAAGRPITQPVRDEFGSGTRPAGELFRLSYQPASPDPAAARLTVRRRHADPRQEIPRSDWAFVDRRTVQLVGRKPEPGSIYEFFYTAEDPKVLGLGFAATRDVVAQLRRDGGELTGRPISGALAIGFSQGGRFLRDFLHQGFNRDEAGGRVFDGMLAHTAGAGRLFCNQPFAQPFRTNTQ